MVHPLHVWLAFKQTFEAIRFLINPLVNSPTVLVFHVTRGLINPLFLSVNGADSKYSGSSKFDLLTALGH